MLAVGYLRRELVPMVTYSDLFIHIRDYALRCYNSCFAHQKQKKIAPPAGN